MLDARLEDTFRMETLLEDNTIIILLLQKVVVIVYKKIEICISFFLFIKL